MLMKLLPALSCFLLFSGSLFAQPVSEDLPKITDCIALVNVKLVSAPGKAPLTSTIVIRDGIITHAGQNINIPADAYRIAADSFFAYPAFIDALSNIGVKEQQETTPAQRPRGPGEPPQRRPVDAEGNLPLEDAGITPFLSVRASLEPTEKSIADWRQSGFAISHVVPRGKMIPGKGSILILTGKNLDQLIWKEDVSLFSQWTGVGGNYPSTVIGMMAKWRELYQNASNHVVHQKAYAGASSIPRPEYNHAHTALMPVVNKEIPVFFKAPKVKDISRALALQEDLGMRMVIADAEEAWYLKDHFKSGSTPLILSLRLPEDKSETKKEKEKEEKEKPSSVPTPDSLKTIEGEKPAPDPEKEAFEKRRNESLKEHRAQAVILAKAGVPFSFGTLSVKTSDFFKNIRLMMDEGLTADQALAALTTQPARLLGIEKNAGTIEVGKMGNVIVSNKPIFDKDAAIKYMIVEGDLYEYDLKEKKKKDKKSSAAALDVVVGKWEYVIESPDKKRLGTFVFNDDEGEIIGTIEGDEITSGNNELEYVVLDGNHLTFTFDMEINGQMVELEFDLTLNGEIFDGTITVGEMGKFPITGKRISKPQE